MRLPKALRAPFAVGLSLTVLFAMVDIGLRLPGIGWLRPSGRASSLDYSAPPLGGFSPLSAPFISSVLGDAVLAGHVERSGPGARRRLRVPPLPIEHDVTHPLSNDDSADAYSVPTVPFRARSQTGGAQPEPGEPRDCAAIGSTVWYRYTPPFSTGIVASTGGSDYATALGIFTKDFAGAWRNQGCHSDPKGVSTVVFPAVAATTYYFQITAPVRGGNLVFRLAPHASTVLASRDDLGRRTRADNEGPPHVSGDGRSVVFLSRADNLDKRCPCPARQAYLRDLVTGRTEMVSLSRDGKPGNADAHLPNLSGDGRFVVWNTSSDNLVPGDTNGTWDVYLRDRRRAVTERVTVLRDGTQLMGSSPTISADGRYVAFMSYHEQHEKVFPHSTPGQPPNMIAHIYRIDRATGRIDRADQSNDRTAANHDSLGPFMTSDGRYVKFWSRASNLVADLPPTHELQNRWLDEYQGREYVHDFVTATTTMECRAADDTPGNDECFGGTISSDGRWSAWWSTATNLMGELVPPASTEPIAHLYLRDRQTKGLERVTLDASGAPCGEVRPRNVSVTRIVSPFGYARVPLTTISADGRFLVFETFARCLQNDTNEALDVFVYDRTSPKTMRISESSFGVQGNQDSFHSDMSADGRVIVYMSYAWNLVADDDNGRQDVYVSVRSA